MSLKVLRARQTEALYVLSGLPTGWLSVPSDPDTNVDVLPI